MALGLLRAAHSTDQPATDPGEPPAQGPTCQEGLSARGWAGHAHSFPRQTWGSDKLPPPYFSSRRTPFMRLVALQQASLKATLLHFEAWTSRRGLPPGLWASICPCLLSWSAVPHQDPSPCLCPLPSPGGETLPTFPAPSYTWSPKRIE